MSSPQPPCPAPSTDNRRTARLRADLPAELLLPDGTAVPARVRDISFGGLGISLGMHELGRLLPPASPRGEREYLVVFSAGGGADAATVRVSCTLRHLRRERLDHASAGLSFCNFHDDGADVLGDYLLRATSASPDAGPASAVELPPLPR